MWARLRQFLKGFNPQQARDERGRWTSGRLGGKVLVRDVGAHKAWRDRIGQPPKVYFAELLNGTNLHVGSLHVSMGRGKLAPKVLKYTAWLTDKDGNHAGWLSREFFDDPLDGTPAVNHEHFSLDKSMQGGGTAKQLLRNAMTQYGRMGIGRIFTQASLSAGGYTWARFGFQPATQEIWDYLRPRIASRLYKVADPVERAAYQKLLQSSDVRTTWLVADSKHGKKLLFRTNYWAVLDLGDATQMRRFRAYVRR